MTGTNHGMTGAVIALLVKQPQLAVPLSFMSHFVCDSLPHYGPPRSEKLFTSKFNKVLSADFIFAVCVMIILGILFPAQRWVIWGCMIAAASPDLMWAYYYLYKIKLQNKMPKFDPLARFHTWIQWSQTPPGIIIEAMWFVAMWTIVLVIR